MNKAHFGLGYLIGATRALLAWIEISHTELKLENKLKIIISIDENDWQHQGKNASLM